MNRAMLDNISFAHLNVASFTRVEIQQLILKRIGKHFQVLNLVETHTKQDTEESTRRRFPEIEFYFNHSQSQANRENHNDGCRGTLIALKLGALKTKNFQIHVPGRLSSLDFDIEGRPYRMTSINACL